MFHVYLKKDVEDSPDFTETPKGAMFLGKSLSEEGTWYFVAHDWRDIRIAKAKEYIEDISLHEFLSCPHRDCGVYHHGSAEALLTMSGKSQWLQIHGKNIKDVFDLFVKISSGFIRPKPEENFERPQSGAICRILSQLKSHLLRSPKTAAN